MEDRVYFVAPKEGPLLEAGILEAATPSLAGGAPQPATGRAAGESFDLVPAGS